MNPEITYWISLLWVIIGCLGIGFAIGNRRGSSGYRRGFRDGYNIAVDEFEIDDDDPDDDTILDKAILEDIYAD